MSDSTTRIPELPDQLIEHLNRGDCVLVVGDALDAAGSQSVRLAALLVDACGAHCEFCRDESKCRRPHHCLVPLARAAQLYESRHNRHALVDFVIRHVDNTSPSPPVYQALAALPVRVIITTAYDDQIERALHLAGRPYHQIVCDTAVPFDDPRHVQIIRLHGTVSQPESLVLTEDDIATLFTRMPAMTDVLRGYLASRTPLFVGHGLDDQHLLALYRQVVYSISHHRRPVYAVLWPPDPFAIDRWHGRISIIPAKPLPFLEKLAQSIRVPITLPSIVRIREDGRYEVMIPAVPGLRTVSSDIATARVVLTELARTKIGPDKEIAVGDHDVLVGDPSAVSVNVEITVAAPEGWFPSQPSSPFDLPTAAAETARRLRSLFEKCYREQRVSIGPGQGPDHVERASEYLELLAQERQGSGASLSDLEWEVLIMAAWLRELERVGYSHVVPEWLDAAALNWAVADLITVDLDALASLASTKVEDGKQLRPQLLGALLLLGESLDIDKRSVEALPFEKQYRHVEVPLALWLRRYLAEISIRSGKIEPVFVVPDLKYVPYLQVWLAGPLRRVFSVVSPVLVEQGWYLWLASSTSEVQPALDPIPEALWQELTDEHTLFSVLRPLIEVLGEPPDADRPRLSPVPLTALRQPPAALTWDLPPLPSGAHYEVRLTDLETGVSVGFQELAEPGIIDLSSIVWQPDGYYRWTVYRRQGRLRRDLTYGLFRILTPEAQTHLSIAEAELPAKAFAVRRELWQAAGLYDDVITVLLDEIKKGPTIVDRLAARRELAETYDCLAQEARRRQLDSLADEYGSLAARQYKHLREFVLSRGGVR